MCSFSSPVFLFLSLLMIKEEVRSARRRRRLFQFASSLHACLPYGTTLFLFSLRHFEKNIHNRCALSQRRNGSKMSEKWFKTRFYILFLSKNDLNSEGPKGLQESQKRAHARDAYVLYYVSKQDQVVFIIIITQHLSKPFSFLQQLCGVWYHSGGGFSGRSREEWSGNQTYCICWSYVSKDCTIYVATQAL